MRRLSTLVARALVRRPLARGAMVCAAGFVALTTWVAIDDSLPGERRALVELRDAIGGSLDDMMIDVRDATNTGPLAGAAAAIALFTFATRRRIDALAFSTGFFLTIALNPVLKEWVGRERPALWPPLVPVSRFSFPSGHAANSAALVAGLVLLVPARHRRVVSVVGCAGLLLVAFSQLGLGVHYPSDIVAGWLWAGACTGAVWSVRGRRRWR